MIDVKILNKSKNDLPTQAHKGDAGFDISANLDKPIKLSRWKQTIIPTGIHMQLPEGYEAQVRPRSGLAAKYGITVLNTPGTIDHQYLGECKVILIQHGLKRFFKRRFRIENGMRIAQIVIQKLPSIEFKEVTELSDTERGENGFGSSGLK